jgi:hypothetical protein
MNAQKVSTNDMPCGARTKHRSHAAQGLHMLLKYAAAICNRLQLHRPLGIEAIRVSRLRRSIAGQRRRQFAELFKATLAEKQSQRRGCITRSAFP